MNNDAKKKMRGALLAFVILQLVYLFSFLISFPGSFRNAEDSHWGALDAFASWMSTLTMLAYSLTCLVSVAQLVVRKQAFLLWFQISGFIAMVGNFLVFILRQISEGWYYDAGIDFYWVLFIMALFWTVIWCMYFSRSSRVFSYMGESTYLRKALFTKNVKEPEPWVEEIHPFYTSYPTYPVNQPPMAPPAPMPGPGYDTQPTAGMPPQYAPVPDAQYQPFYPGQEAPAPPPYPGPGYPVPTAPPTAPPAYPPYPAYPLPPNHAQGTQGYPYKP